MRLHNPRLHPRVDARLAPAAVYESCGRALPAGVSGQGQGWAYLVIAGHGGSALRPREGERVSVGDQ